MRSGWQTGRLGDVCEVIKGRKPILKLTPSEGDLPYLVARVMRGNEEARYASVTDRNAITVEDNDTIIICDGSNSGEVFTGFRGILSSTMGKIAKKAPIDDDYLRAFLTSTFEVFNGSKTGAAIPHLDKEAMYQLEFPFPPLSEQKRIVSILDEAFEGISTAVANAEKNLADARELFDSYLNDVFIRKGKSWVERTLESLMDVTHGFAFDGRDFETCEDPDKFIVLTPGNYTEHAELSFTPKNTKRLNGSPPTAFLFEPGELTIVMTDLSSKMKILGKPAFVEQANVLHNQRIGRVRIKDASVTPRFVYYFLRTQKVIREIKMTSTGTMVRHTAPKRILSIAIPLPEGTRDQQEITGRLDGLSSEIRNLEDIYQQKLTNLAELKQAILQKAFAGELTAQPEKAQQEAAAAA
jgi:type I restriction enzyme S subunit